MTREQKWGKIVRGQKVMLDVDLAKIYGYETKAFNQQVKRNIEKFDDDFMFQLTKEESEKYLRSQNVTLNKSGNLQGQHIKYLPYAFTEQGIYMLMTVLKGELATKQSKAIIRLFKRMKDYISSNALISTEDFLKLSIQTNENTSAISRIESEMLKKSDLPMIIKAFSKEQVTEYPSIMIDFKKNNTMFHDRYIILDYGTKNEKVYHCGASSKDAGKKIMTITESKDKTIYRDMIDIILQHPQLVLK